MRAHTVWESSRSSSFLKTFWRERGGFSHFWAHSNEKSFRITMTVVNLLVWLMFLLPPSWQIHTYFFVWQDQIQSAAYQSVVFISTFLSLSYYVFFSQFGTLLLFFCLFIFFRNCSHSAQNPSSTKSSCISQDAECVQRVLQATQTNQ